MVLLSCIFVLSLTRVPRLYASLKTLDAIDQRPTPSAKRQDLKTNVAQDVACYSKIDAVQHVDHDTLEPKTSDLQRTWTFAPVATNSTRYSTSASRSPSVHRSPRMVDETRHIQHMRVAPRQFDKCKTCTRNSQFPRSLPTLIQRPSALDRAPLPIEPRLAASELKLHDRRSSHNLHSILRHRAFLDGGDCEFIQPRCAFSKLHGSCTGCSARTQ